MSVEIDPKLCFALMPRRDEFIEPSEGVIKATAPETLHTSYRYHPGNRSAEIYSDLCDLVRLRFPWLL